MGPAALATVSTLFAQQPHRLPAPLRAKALMALLSIVVLGIGLIFMVVLAGRAARRRLRQRSGPTNPPDDAWYQKPLMPPGPLDAGETPDDES